MLAELFFGSGPRAITIPPLSVALKLLHNVLRHDRPQFGLNFEGGTLEASSSLILMAVSGGSSSVPSLPPPRPPEYPALYGKRRELAKVQMLEREISFLEEELKFVHGLQPASRSCKEYVNGFAKIGRSRGPVVSGSGSVEQPVSTSHGFAVSAAFLGVALVRTQDALTASHAAAVVAFRGVLHARIALADVDALVPTVSRQTRVSVVPRTVFVVQKTVATLVVYILQIWSNCDVDSAIRVALMSQCYYISIPSRYHPRKISNWFWNSELVCD
ncbi:hypothetical protein RHSIM_Rhsim03G0227100 [Rhododendron simsii]|uniref:G protein gamma domain-containing protein n=1 Tax=Rhododendron simsii TaxID=118357 RepID=A0A834H6N5_RHOSS|nr:hypothetical protein RHSIM_Rhsim03G0227100 [Rhododendron simsii]